MTGRESQRDECTNYGFIIYNVLEVRMTTLLVTE